MRAKPRHVRGLLCNTSPCSPPYPVTSIVLFASTNRRTLLIAGTDCMQESYVEGVWSIKTDPRAARMLHIIA